jgi:hypothetical protein
MRYVPTCCGSSNVLYPTATSIEQCLRHIYGKGNNRLDLDAEAGAVGVRLVFLPVGDFPDLYGTWQLATGEAVACAAFCQVHTQFERGVPSLDSPQACAFFYLSGRAFIPINTFNHVASAFLVQTRSAEAA